MALDAKIEATFAKQGKLGGSSPLKGREGSSICTKVDYQIECPADPQSGLAMSKRLHKPVAVTIEVDAATVKWINAITQNETVTSVTISFYQPVTQGLAQGQNAGTGGEAKPCMTLQLNNAIVQKYEFRLPDTRSQDPDHKNRNMNITVHLAFMEIIQTWTQGGQTAADNWVSPT